jgi:hypothetical protein
VTPVAVAVSALFPKVTDLSRIGRAGQPNVASSLIYMSSVALAGSPAAAAIAIAVRLLELPWLAPVFVLVYAGAAVAAARALLPVAERLVVARLENLALVVTSAPPGRTGLRAPRTVCAGRLAGTFTLLQVCRRLDGPGAAGRGSVSWPGSLPGT